MPLIHSRVALSLLLSSGLIIGTLANSYVPRDTTDFSWASVSPQGVLSVTKTDCISSLLPPVIFHGLLAMIHSNAPDSPYVLCSSIPRSKMTDLIYEGAVAIL